MHEIDNNGERLLSADAVCALLCISRKTLTAWVEDGYFPAPERLGRKTRRWPVSAVNRFREESATADRFAKPSTIEQKEEKMAESFFYDPYEDHLLIGREEAESMLHCSTIDLYRYVQSGQLPVVTEDGRKRFKFSDVAKLQDSTLLEISKRMRLEEFQLANPDLAETE